MNREQWLSDVARLLATNVFKEYLLGPYRVTMGWPCRGGVSSTRRVVGECHSPRTSTGGVHEIFISPLLEKPSEVSGALAHELAHVAAGVEAQHGKLFQHVCRRVGLTKGDPWCVMPGDSLAGRLALLTAKTGPYPHSAMKLVAKVKKPRSTLSLTCPACYCKISMGIKWLGVSGLPTCGCGAEFSLTEPADV